MKSSHNLLGDSFLCRCLPVFLRWFPPHERRELRALAMTEHADELGNEPTVRISLRVPVSLAIRLDIERGNLKRQLRRRRVSRSEVARRLLSVALAEPSVALDTTELEEIVEQNEVAA